MRYTPEERQRLLIWYFAFLSGVIFAVLVFGSRFRGGGGGGPALPDPPGPSGIEVPDFVPGDLSTH